MFLSFILIAAIMALAVLMPACNVTRDNVPSQGGRVTYTNSGSAIAAGDLVVLRSGTSGTCGVAVTDIAATTGTGEVYTGEGQEKIFKTTTKPSGEAWTIGQILYTDGTSVTSTSSTTFTRCGTAAAPAASADTTAYFFLNGK